MPHDRNLVLCRPCSNIGQSMVCSAVNVWQRERNLRSAKSCALYACGSPLTMLNRGYLLYARSDSLRGDCGWSVLDLKSRRARSLSIGSLGAHPFASTCQTRSPANELPVVIAAKLPNWCRSEVHPRHKVLNCRLIVPENRDGLQRREPFPLRLYLLLSSAAFVR